ncbi:MAG: hypothetical protein M9896_14180 [Candidatus Promineofilum sp.]|uniref:hypothetical protein n=1 Tax=Promineifilum sp. TaxID=2664178 RepID=UPI002411A3AA|nr:hypothetical protein [Promineifilum sp.]
MTKKSTSRLLGQSLLFGTLITLLLLAAGARTVAPVAAAFPGANGRIAFTITMDGNTDIWTMDEYGGAWIRLTNNAAFDGNPAWSPDGNRLAFVSDRTGNSEIFVMNADGSGQRNVTRNAAADNTPAWSRDGTRIVFSSSQYGGGLFVVDLLNNDIVTQKTSNPSDFWPAWSPVDDRIAFARPSASGLSDVYVLNVSNNQVTNLTDAYSPSVNLPNWSPDGKSLVVVSNPQGGGNHLYKMPADGSGPLVPLPSPGPNELWPSFSPDGQWIVYQGPRTVANVTSHELMKISAQYPDAQPWQLTFGFGTLGAYFNPDWQPRVPNSITVEVYTSDSTLPPTDWTLQGNGPIGNFTIAANGGTRTFTSLPPGDYTITQTAKQGYSAPPPCEITLAAGEALECDFENYYDYSATGELVFSSNTDGRLSIYRMFSDGIGRRRLTSLRGQDEDPTWSPNGKEVAFVGDYALWVMNADGLKQSLRLSHPGWSISSPSWSPYEDEIAFSSDKDGVDRLYMVNPNGTGERPIVDAQGQSIDPAISLSGDEVALSRYVNGQSDIYLGLTGATIAPINLTKDSALDYNPAWSPDDRRIVYSSRPAINTNSDLWIVDRAGVKKQLTFTPESEIQPAWSPDGSQIAYTRVVGSQVDIFVMNADGSGTPEQITFNPGWDGAAEWRPKNVGALTVKMAVNGPAPAADWQFTSDALGNFTLPAAGGSLTFHNQPPGSYSVAQTAQGGYTPSFSCDNGVTGGASLTLQIMTGRHVSCTFTSTAQGTGLTITKSLVGPAPATPWQFSVSSQPNFSLPAAGGSRSLTNLAAGTYTIQETTQPGYTSQVACLPGGESGGASVTVTLNPGQQKTCTFTNTAQFGTIKIVQQVKPNNTAGPAPWSFTGDLGTFLIPKEGGEKTFANRPAGSYTINQSNVDGFGQSVNCDSGESGKRSVTVVLEPNETITCTFRATKNNPAPGTLVYSSNRDGDYDIYLLDPTTRDGQPIQLTNSPGDDTDPTLSPDGTFIVFTSTRDGNPELYLMDYDGEFPTRLTNAPTIQRRPAISPDGTQIAYESDETGNNEVYTMPLASRAPVRVTNNPANDGDPTWVPGPQPRLVYTSDRDGNPELYSLDLSVGGQSRRLTNNPAVDYAPVAARRSQTPVVAYSCQPDGSILSIFVCAFLLDDQGRISTAEPIILTDAPGVNYPLAWSAGGEQIIFSSTRNGNAEIYTMTADGEDETRLTDDPAADGPADPTPLRPGTITLRAVVHGDPPAGPWQFGGDLGSFTLPATGGEMTFNDQTAGSYWVSEAAVPGFTRTASCTGGTAGVGSVVLNLDPAQTVTCTFVHTADGATVIYTLFAPVVIR